MKEFIKKHWKKIIALGIIVILTVLGIIFIKNIIELILGVGSMIGLYFLGSKTKKIEKESKQNEKVINDSNYDDHDDHGVLKRKK